MLKHEVEIHASHGLKRKTINKWGLVGVWISVWCIITTSLRRDGAQKDRRKSLELTEMRWRWRGRAEKPKGDRKGELLASVCPAITSNISLDSSTREWNTTAVSLSLCLTFLFFRVRLFVAFTLCVSPSAASQESHCWLIGHTVWVSMIVLNWKRENTSTDEGKGTSLWESNHLMQRLPNGVSITHTHTHPFSRSHSSPSNLSWLFFSPSSVCLLCSTSLGSSSALISQATAPQLLLIWSE